MTQTRSVSWQDDKIKMAVYEPFPGVQVMKVSVRAPGFIEERRKSNRLEINFCVSGRFECEFTKRDIAILKPGDMAISLFDGENGINSYSRFPMDFYEGISILLDCDIAEEWLKEHLEVFDIHLQILRERKRTGIGRERRERAASTCSGSFMTALRTKRPPISG